MADKLKLVEALVAEHGNNTILKDLVGDGDINITVLCSSDILSVIRVNHNNTSFIIKQFNSAGVEANKSMHLEYKALELRSQFVPGSVPQPYLFSDKQNCVVMEDFKAYGSLTSQLKSGQIDEPALNRLIHIIALLHKGTIGQENLSQLGKEFINNMDSERLLKSKFVDTFSNETISKHINTSLTGVERVLSDEVKQKVTELYKTIVDNKQAVIHGNLNAENIVVHDGQIKLLGNHFTMVGPCSLDVATLLAQYLAYYHIHMLTEQDNDAHRQVAYKMITAAQNLVDGYLKEMTSMDDQTSGEQFVSSVAGLCGVEMVNWAVNASNGSDSVAILDSGLRLINAAHRIHSGSMLVNIALMLTH